MTNADVVRNEAPDPLHLRLLVDTLLYKAGWEFRLDDDFDRGQGSRGFTLVITLTTPDSYRPDETRTVLHLMPVPPAAYDYRSWRRWLFDQIGLVEDHERCEFFTIAGGEKPYGVRVGVSGGKGQRRARAARGLVERAAGDSRRAARGGGMRRISARPCNPGIVRDRA